MYASDDAGERPAARLARGAVMIITGALISVLVVLGLAGTAQAADRNVRLTLQPSDSACTPWDQMDCSYLEVRDGNSPAPDPDDPTATPPTFLNMADLPGPVTIDASIADDGTVTVQPDSVKFPPYPTSLSNDLVGDVAIQIQISAADTWAGTFDETTGEMSLTAPLGLTFKLNCEPTNGLCGAIFGPEGNMGTWEVTPKGPVDSLTTGTLDAPAPPAAYGPEWVGPDAEQGTPFDPDTGIGTLINNDLEISNLTAENCIDDTSVACSNPGIGNLIAPSLNGALGTVYDPADPENDRDSVPGAIDMQLTFAMSEPPLIESDPTALAFPGMNEDGSQPLGTSSAAVATTLAALDAGDITVRSIYTDGGDANDFNVTNARGCLPEIESGGTCKVNLRFNPSATGNRASTLYASIVSPVSGSVERIELATLSGVGGIFPKGEKGDKGDPGSPGAAGPLVEIHSKTFVRLRTSQRTAATVASRGARVSLKTPKRIAVRIGKRKYKVAVKAPGRVNAGKKAKIRIRGTRGAVKALKRIRRHKGKKPTVKIRIRVASQDGRTLTRKIGLKLR